MAKFNDQPNLKRTVVASTILISGLFSLILGLGLYLFAGKLSVILNNVKLFIPLRITAIALIFNSVFTSCQGLLSGEKKFKKIAIIKSVYGLGMLIFTVVFFKLWGLDGAAFGLLATFLVSSLICIKNLRVINAFKDTELYSSIKYSKKLISFSLPIAIQEAINAIMQWLLIYIIVKLSDYGQLGLYTASAQWLAVITFIPYAMRYVALSHLSSTTNNAIEHKKIYHRLFIITLTTVLIPLCLIIVFSEFISSFYGETFKGMPIVLCVLCSSSIFDALLVVITQEYTSRGKTWIICISRLIGNFSALLLILFLIKTSFADGALSASIGMLFSSIIILFVLYLIIRFGGFKSSKPE